MSRQRQKQLGQYFTPLAVIDFALDALDWLSAGDADDADSRRIIDPACGDGGFLWRALERELARPGGVHGLDLDAGLAENWPGQGADAEAGPYLAVADGLLADNAHGRPVGDGSFDWVVGNPPYAGEGLKGADEGSLARIAAEYELARLRWKRPIKDISALRTLPVEVLFVERFWRLCRDGGLIAIVLPVGIFANSRWGFVREWLMERSTVEAVVSLPRKAFRTGGITAKTCLAIARKTPAPADHEVLLAEVEHIGIRGEVDELPDVLRLWQEGGQIATDERPWRLK